MLSGGKTVFQENTRVDPGVYNGTRKIFEGNEMFMSSMEVERCIQSIKVKNSEGFVRIPQRILVDGIEHLLPTLVESMPY